MYKQYLDIPPSRLRGFLETAFMSLQILDVVEHLTNSLGPRLKMVLNNINIKQWVFLHITITSSLPKMN